MDRNKVVRIVFDGTQISSEGVFHDQMSRALEFPVHYGNNLAALRDVLLPDDGRTIQIVWTNSGESRLRLGKDFLRIKTVLEDLAKERGNLSVHFL
jgi:RNAse (barnase) inhibitor barstar